MIRATATEHWQHFPILSLTEEQYDIKRLKTNIGVLSDDQIFIGVGMVMLILSVRFQNCDGNTNLWIYCFTANNSEVWLSCLVFAHGDRANDF